MSIWWCQSSWWWWGLWCWWRWAVSKHHINANISTAPVARLPSRNEASKASQDFVCYCRLHCLVCLHIQLTECFIKWNSQTNISDLLGLARTKVAPVEYNYCSPIDWRIHHHHYHYHHHHLTIKHPPSTTYHMSIMDKSCIANMSMFIHKQIPNCHNDWYWLTQTILHTFTFDYNRAMLRCIHKHTHTHTHRHIQIHTSINYHGNGLCYISFNGTLCHCSQSSLSYHCTFP